MTVTLIITTYNRKDALRLALNGALCQTRLPDEIIVADDGSTDGTEREVKIFDARSPVPIIHSWQENRGFRAAASRNRAMAKAGGGYIVFIDGDIIPERHFIEDHLRAAEKGCFVQGSRVLLSERKTAELLSGGTMEISFFDAGIENRKNRIRSRFFSRLFSRKTMKLAGIRTCNFAFWKHDAVRVNGFNEDFIGWGREDSEFAVRLINSGINRKNLRFKALVYHLYHPENRRDNLAYNDRLLEAAITGKLTWCENGLNRHLTGRIGNPPSQGFGRQTGRNRKRKS